MNNNLTQRRIVYGILIVLVGVVALLDNLHVFSARAVLQFWPTVFIVLGGLKMAQARNRTGYVVGALLITAGGLILLQRLGLIWFSWRELWPVALIAVGVLTIFKKGLGDALHQGVTAREGNALSASADDDNLDVLAIMGGHTMTIVSQDFRGGEVTSVMGGAEIDLRHASMQSEAIIHVFIAMGGLVLKVPTDWAVITNGVPIMGGIDDKSVPPMNPSKRLVVKGFILMGGVEIKN
jgi:hypothetical protein